MFNYKFYSFLVFKFLVIIFVNSQTSFDSSDLNNIENYSYDSNSLEIKSEYDYSIIKSCLYTTEINSTESDKNIFYIHNYSDLKLNQLSINKQGETNDTEKSEEIGINSAILVTNFSSSIIFNTTIKTNGIGAHAIFLAGEKSYVKIYNSTIITYQNNSKGLVSKYKSSIMADEVEIITTNIESSNLYCDNSEITCFNSTLTTIGNKSPIIFSIGKVTIEKVIGTALHSNMIILKNRNSVYIKDSKLYCNAEGVITDSEIDYAGIFMYDSYYINNIYSANNFVAYNSSFNVLPSSNDIYYKTSMFSVVNSNANITLLGYNNFSFGNKNFLNVHNDNSNTRRSKVFLFLKGENINGNINSCYRGEINIYLTENSTLKGVLKRNSGQINLYIDSTSTLNLTNNSDITNLYLKGTINKKKFLTAGHEYEEFNSDIILPNITSLNKINEDVECNKTSPINSTKENNDDSSSSDNNGLEIDEVINNNENNQNNGKYLNLKFLFLLFIIHFI